MVFEQKKMLIRKVVWLAVLIVNIILFFSFSKGRTATLVSDECFVEYSTSSYDGEVYGSDCELVLTYNKNVEEGEVEVAFFDSNGKEICVKKSAWGTTDGKQITYTFYVSGNADAYEIIAEGAISKTNGAINSISLTMGFVSLIAIIINLFDKCKVFNYEDKEIIIYAGPICYYIKINGELYDKKKSWYSFNRRLSCTVSENFWVDVDVGAFNNISVKINDKLYNS